MDDLVQWLRAQLDEDERIARASVEQASVNLAGAEPSSVSVWHVVDRPATGTFVATRDQWERVAEVVPTYGGAHADHIATHDPERVLREIDAKRQLLDDFLAEPHFHNEEDNWYTCAALVDEDGEPVCIDESRAPGPCDCGRDRRVRRRVAILALPYADRPGYRPDWRP
ncbi:DUF6221 family protein [Streptomyces sp. NPDC057367]|uniref:DUF6221 family protein n=1 Tax=Streptomyces sp. NPDC057367 TaxID=3346108 RepID=UPI0036367C4D